MRLSALRHRLSRRSRLWYGRKNVQRKAPAPDCPMNLWRDIVDSLGDAIVVLSDDLEPAALNPAAETLLGVSKASSTFIDELLGRNEWLSRMVHSCLKSGQNLSDPEADLRLLRHSVLVRAEVSPWMRKD